MAYTVREIREQDLEMIMRWRMSEDVTKYMNTNPKLTLEGQKKWFASLAENKKIRNWLIEVDGIPAGIINLENIDRENKTTSWGYYIGENHLRSIQLAISLELSLYDYVFDVLGFEEIRGEVFSLNAGVIKLHKLCGCRIVKEEKGEVVKEGISYDVTHLAISKEEWGRIKSKYTYEKIDYDIKI